MRALDLKLVRDLARMKAQAFAIVAVIGCATGTFVATRGTQTVLTTARDLYYGRQRFADVFATLKRAPARALDEAGRIDGVAEAEGRVVTDVPLFVEGFAEPVTARLVSLPERGRLSLNRVDVRRGELPAASEALDGVVSEAFAQAHALRPGATLVVIIEGRRRQLRISGIGVSPEYLYQIRPGDIMPDDAHYGIIWLNRATLESALAMHGAFNDVALRVDPRADEGAVLADLDRVLAPYGGRGAYGRGSQTSNRFLSDEVLQLEMMTLAVPAVLLGVAAFLLSVVVGRLVSTQREQIGLLKAFGYSNGAVAVHYAKLVGVVALAGAVLGLGVGALIGSELTRTYLMMFRLPRQPFALDATTGAVSVLLSLAAAELGVLRAVSQAVAVTPATAMRPKPPASYRRTLLERFPLFHSLSQTGRMAARDMARRPVRVLLTTISLSFAVGIVIVGAFIVDAMMAIANQQFRVCERGDATVLLSEPHHASTLRELARAPGVRGTEGFRSVGAVLRHHHRGYRTEILGLEGGSRLRRVIDDRGRRTPLPAQGLVLTDRLAEFLGVAPGDEVEAEVLEGARPRLRTTVVAVASENLGMTAYADLRELNRIMGTADAVSGAYVSVDPSLEGAFQSFVRNTPQLAGVTLRRLALASFDAVVAGHIMEVARILMLASCAIAIGVLYSSAQMSFAEKQRELATLRVLGFTRRETTTVLLGELAALLIIALPLGCLLGRWVAALLSLAMSSDLYRLPVVVLPSTYLFTVGVVVVAGVAVGLLLKRGVDRLVLAEVLSTRE